MRRVLEHAVGRVHVSGVRITYDPGGRDGSRIVDALFADGTPLADGRTYALAVGQYLTEGGDGFTMLRDMSREDVGMKSLDALIAHLQGAPQPFAIPRDRRFVQVN